MYSPGAFVETDLAALDWLLARDPFVTLVSCDEAVPFATHLPVLYSRQGERVLLVELAAGVVLRCHCVGLL